MKFYVPAALPMLYNDEKTIGDFVSYLCSCDHEPTPQEVSEATGISLEICKEKVPVVLELNRQLINRRNKRSKALKDYLDNCDSD